MTSDIRPATQDDAPSPTQVPRRARPWRLFLKGGALALMLGVGWIAGRKRMNRRSSPGLIHRFGACCSNSSLS